MHERDVAITFAGGGNRAFYQLGLMNRWRDLLLPRVGVVAACSAGACVAALLFSERQDEAATFWYDRVRGIRRNLDWRRMLRGEPPAPHGAIYRATIEHAVRDGGLARIQEQPFPILVLTTAFPRLLPAAAAVPLGLGLYNLEKRLAPHRIHPTFGRRAGFAPVVFDMRECETVEEVADLVLASSATPPFTPVGLCRNRRLLDGGMIDNVPAWVADDAGLARRNLVLLTRPYPDGVTGPQGSRLYLAPSRPVPVERWDYTQPHRVEETVRMGEEESELHAPLLHGFLEA